MEEPNEKSTLVPLSVMATDICDDLGDSDGKHKAKHLKNIVKFYKDLYIYLMNDVNVKSQILPCDNIIDLPADFIKEFKVGVINDQGRIACLSLDKKLRTVPCQVKTDTEFMDVVNGIMLADDLDLGELYPFYNTYDLKGNYLGEQYGAAQSINTLGYFNVDRTNNTMIVSPTLQTGDLNIIIEYKSDGVSEGLKLVPSELVNCLTFRAKAIFCLDQKDSRYGTYNAEYELAYKNVKRLYKAKPIDLYAKVFKEQHRYSPK